MWRALARRWSTSRSASWSSSGGTVSTFALKSVGLVRSLSGRMSGAAGEFQFVEGVLSSRESGFEAGPAASSVIASNLEGAETRLRALVESCGAEAARTWLGKGAAEEAQVAQWLHLKLAELEGEPTPEALNKCLADMNAHLLRSSFLATAARPTLADLSMFWAVKDHAKAEMGASLPSFCRWFDQMQHSPAVREALGPEYKPVVFDLGDPWTMLKAGNGAAPSAAAPAQGESKPKKQKGGDKAAAQEQQGKSKGGKAAENKKGKKPQEQQQQKKAAAPEAAAADQPEATKLDIRVGKIVKCWQHENSEKLYCEVIDVGEEEPRPIASGLVAHYASADMLQDRMVLVLCNLKPAKMGGYTSNGMVLCASNDDKSKVEIIDPPAGAKIGERVTLEGLPDTFEPFKPNQVAKKKVLQACLPNLKTDDACQPYWQGPDGTKHTFKTSAGPCKALSITGGWVS